MGAKMRRLRLTKLLLLFVVLAAVPLVCRATHEGNYLPNEIKASRIKRDADGITTVLLVPARPGKSAPPVGVLTKTARTFVQDGASTEYATEVLGTTLDNGRLYAKILSTSSRVFYDREFSADPLSPYVVYPSKINDDGWHAKLSLHDVPMKIVQTINDSKNKDFQETIEKEDDLKDNDIFNKREQNEIKFKPAKVRTDNLPTYTVKQDYVAKGLDFANEDEQPKSFRPRAPKIFRPQQKVSQKKQDAKPLATVTYHGFADFVTTVGDTVIVFSPSTSPAPVGRPATTIKGDATLRPNDGIAVLKIKPTNVLSENTKTEAIHNQNNHPNEFIKNDVKSNDNNGILDLQPSTTGQPEAGYSREVTSPLFLTPDEATALKNPTGLIKVVDSTAINEGTTTHYMSSIYGTYIGKNYAQIVHTSSNVYFHPEDSTRGFDLSENNEDHDIVTKDGFSDSSTLPPDTTDNILTTLKEILTTEATTESELGNDIIPQNQGRSIKGSSSKNDLLLFKEQKHQDSENESSIATRLIPSTIYKTFTYFTTFFIPNQDGTTTSVKSREEVSSDITFLTELISPSSTQTSPIDSTISPSTMNKVEISSNTDLVEHTNNVEKQEVEEIQLIFKTIFTTFTYLTTFYDDSTTSVSSRKVTATNVITQTVDPISTLIDVDGLINREESVLIAPTKLADVNFINSESKFLEPQININDDNIKNNNENIYNNNIVTEESTENILTTAFDQLSTIEEQSTTESTTESNKNEEEPEILLEPNPGFSENTQFINEQLKTYYTTYTYFTTIIVDDETEIETRTEVYSNIITETIEPTPVSTLKNSITATNTQQEAPPEILAYLEALSLAKKAQAQTQATTAEEINEMITEDPSLSFVSDETTVTDDTLTTEDMSADGEVLGSMKTDVIFTSSSGGSTLLDLMDKKINLPEDQELSETNHHEVEPAPTLLLQTSYTTYTYFTTMYNGDATDVVSRLKTVTNIVTETIRPTPVVQPESKTIQPLTYFTTFTYWTTFIKGDETATTSREETVSNIVTPGVTESSSVQLDVVKTYRPFVLATPVHSVTMETRESKATSDNEVNTSPNIVLKEIPTVKANELSSTISAEPVTLYTTYTYFTTSYIGNSTILNSRLETVTSVSYPDDLIVKATPRAIGGAAPTQLLNNEEKPIQPNKVNNLSKTGLLSTIRSSEINEGTTTHYTTDIYGTYIDGLYAQVVETSSKLELPTSVPVPTATPTLPTGILSLNKGTIIDADEITTVYYTTKQIGTSINGLYAKIIESTSTTKVNEEKLVTHTPVHGHRTGLVRLIKGHIESNDSTIYYQSKVIGTSIDGRYAQIIESTSSYLISKPTSTIDIAATSTLPQNHATEIPAIAPSPAVIQSSISEDHTSEFASNDSNQEENENDDEDDDQKSKKKSRLTFSSRKRTSSAPPIRPFASRSRPTFNPKRKPQGATTITRSDITPTITATLAGKGNRFATSRGRATPSLSSTINNASNSRRFSGRRSSLPSTSSFSTNYPAGSSRNRGGVRVTPSSIYSGSRRGPTSIRGSSARPASRSGSSILSLASTRYRPGIRPSSTLSKISSTIRQDDQEDNANEFTTATLATEETPIQEDNEEEVVRTTIQTTTESSKRTNNPLLRFRRPPAFGSGIRSTTPRVNAAATSRRTNNLSRQNTNNRNINSRTKTTASNLNTKSRQTQSSLFPPRSLFGRKPDTTELPLENKNENFEDEQEDNFEDEAVEEIADNDYEGSEQKEISPLTPKPNSPQIKPFSRIGRGRRVRRQTQVRSLNSRFRRPSIQSSKIEDRIDSDVSSSKEDVFKQGINNSRYNPRSRALTGNSRPNGNKEEKSSEEYLDNSNAQSTRSRSKSSTSRSSLRVKPSHVTNSNRQFTLRDKESTSSKPNYKRPTSSSRSTNLRSRTNSRSRGGTNKYQDVTSTRRTTTRTPSRSGARTNNRRVVPSRGRVSSHEDYRDTNDFDSTITVTHYVPTEVTIPVVNNGITEKRNIITAQPSTEIIGPDRYSTIANSDGQDLVVLASEMTGTNFQGQIEITRFVIHETPTTKVSHMLTSSGGRRFSQPVVVPSTIYSIENVVSTVRPSVSDNAPLANILLSQLLLGQLGQQNPLLPAPAATPSTRYDTRATTYVTTITKHRSTVIPLTFRGKEILTTLVDSSTDVITATELITDTVVVTPSVVLPAANLNSLLLLLQQPQSPQQSNPLFDPLFAAAPLFTQSNTLPGEVERRNQPVDSDYKQESYEDLSEEDIEKPSKVRIKTNAGKTRDREAPDSSVITLYVSGRRPGEFSTVLSTVKVGEESTNDYYINPSSIPSAVEDYLNYGKKTQDPDDYVTEDDNVAKKRVRIRIPIIRSRNVKEHALTVIRKRPLTPYTRSSSFQPVDSVSLFVPRRIVTRTRVKNFNSFDPENNLNDDSFDDLLTKHTRHKITVTRRRKIMPTQTYSINNKERITRKKLVTVRPVPEPTTTLSIITTGFYTIPSFEENEEYIDYDDYPETTTPDLYTSLLDDFIISTSPLTLETLSETFEEPSITSDPIIITDNFFLPELYEETTINDNEYNYDEESTTEPNEFMELTTINKTELENLNDNFTNKQITTEQEVEITTEQGVDITTEQEIEMTTEQEIEMTTEQEIEMTTEIPTIASTDENEPINILENSTTINNLTILDNNSSNETVEEIHEEILNATTTTDINLSQKEIETVKSDVEYNLTVIPIKTDSDISSIVPLNSTKVSLPSSSSQFNLTQNEDSSEIPSVIPLESITSSTEELTEMTSKITSLFDSQVTTSLPSLTPEDIEAGLTDDLYLSLSRPDFPHIVPSKVDIDENHFSSSDSSQATPELQTSVYYSETVVTSTRLRTYTYVVTKLNGQETEVTSSTTVRPRVTTLTLTVPTTVTVTPTMISSSVAFNSSSENANNNEETEDEGRRFNLAKRVMSNGVEVIVAESTPAYRWENSNPQPTLTLSEAVVMLLPQDKLNEFVTKTCTTTFTYLNTITRDGTTIVSTDQQVIANTATEERHRKPASEAASVTLEASPTLQTEVFKTTYTYLTLNTDHPDEKNALGSSTKVIANTVTAPQYYLDTFLDPSETQTPETNTYLSTRILEKTFVEDGKTKIETTNDVVTQLIITESALPPRPTSTSVSKSNDESYSTTDIAQTYYVTYTYLTTYLEKDSTVVKTNIATSSDIVYEKAPVKKTNTKSLPVKATPEPIQIFATKTYLTTHTYFTTLLQAGADGETSTIVSSRIEIVKNAVTESIAPSLLDAGYMNALLTTSHYSDSLKNVVTGSTIIFFDDEEPISPTTSQLVASTSTSIDKIDNGNINASSSSLDSVASETNDSTMQPFEQENSSNEEETVEESTNPPVNKKPLQVSNLLSLGSLGINSLSALGPVITAMAGLLQGKTAASRRNDTETGTELSSTTTTQRSPIYIPVAEFVDGDIETAESQNIALHLANNNHLPETRHKVTSSLADGIPISPGEVITANSDVIIGKPGKLGPRPPHTFLNDENIGMKPPPIPVNIPLHPASETIENASSRKIFKIQKGSQQLEIYPAHQIYEEHVKVPINFNPPMISKIPQNLPQASVNMPSKKISSKQDVLENDPLLVPPSVLLNINKDSNYRRPWSPRNPLSASSVINEEKIHIHFPDTETAHTNNISSFDSLKIKSLIPEPIVHQVPHVIDRSTGQPLLVNIQPSQVANVIIPQGGTQALIFGDTNEPHITGQYFDDPSPYPEPEVGPGFIGINKIENHSQYLKTSANNPAYFMTPPSPPINFKSFQNSNVSHRHPIIPFSQSSNFIQHKNTALRPEKVPIRQHDDSNLSTGQSHVHTEILVHHGAESGHLRPQTHPIIPLRKNLQHSLRQEHTKIHFSPESIPPRRTELPLTVGNSFYDSVNAPLQNAHWKNDKKPLRNSETRWPRPTIKSRPPTRVTARPFNKITRIERLPVINKQPDHTNVPRYPTNIFYQNDFDKNSQQISTVAPTVDLPIKSNQQIFISGAHSEIDSSGKVNNYYQDTYGNINSQDIKNQSLQESKDYITDEHFIIKESNHKKPLFNNENHQSNVQAQKTIDSEVDASENIKMISLGNEDSVIDSENNKYSTTTKFDYKLYYLSNASANNDSSEPYEKHSQATNSQKKNNGNNGDIIIGSEKKSVYTSRPFSTEINNLNNRQNFYVTNTNTKLEQNPVYGHEIIDLKPPAIIPIFEPNGHSRPYSKPNLVINSQLNKSDKTIETSTKSSIFKIPTRPEAVQISYVQTEKNNLQSQLEGFRNGTYLHLHPDRQRLDYLSTRVHPAYPQIITKPKPQIPGSVVISSDKIHKQINNVKSPIQFSLPINSNGEENESKTQTERPPSAESKKITTNNQKSKEESLDTAFQTNFASTLSEDEKPIENKNDINIPYNEPEKITTPKSKLLSHDLTSPLTHSNKGIKSHLIAEELKPPPSPTEVLGLSPPPIDITTTRPFENKQNRSKITSDVSGLKPPPLYIPLKESSKTPSLPSISMVPPSPRPSVVRPYLAEILSRDMVPPPPNEKTARPLEIATVRPGVAVSGSIQIATAVATSHIPVMQDIESKIPIVHGTVDLPVVVDVPEFLKPIDIKKPDHVSIYTIRPFETKHRNTIKPSIFPTNTYSSAIIKQSAVEGEHISNNEQTYPFIRVSSANVKKPNKSSDFSIVLEPSSDIHLPSTRIEPTDHLIISTISDKEIKQKSSTSRIITQATGNENSENFSQNRTQSTKIQKTDLKIKESASKMMEIIGTVVHEFIQNSSNERAEVKPQEVTRFETLTVTRTETSVVGSPPTTRTLLITHTLTSTRVETVTETLLRPTNVISTITSTILQSVTHIPTYHNENDNESIFVVLSDQKPPAPGAEEVEAEYGEEDISRDEQNISGNEIHRVLSGGILGAPSVPIRSPKIQCIPECKASKSEMCSESRGEMRCICRPGFARMFPDRPCKPTYTFTIVIGLDRLGRNHFIYDPKMNDTNSVAFKHYAHPVKEALDRTLMQSDLRDVYQGLNIVKFLPDPAKILFNVQLSSNTNEEKLKEVIRKYLVISNYSLGGTDVYASKDLGLIEAMDFDECTTEDGGPYHDCSPNAACFNLKGSYQCSCKEGYADLSENSAYPGRFCSQAPLGCAACNNKGHCLINSHGHEVCECFPWHSGQKCQVNLKVLLIALVTTGTILLGLLAVCLGMACFRNPNRRRTSADQRAMISGTGGDTSSEGSVTELAIPHHVPHILPPPPQMVAPTPPVKKAVRNVSGKPRRSSKKPAPVIAPAVNNSCPLNDQRDRSLTVMIPRAKYRSAPQSVTPQNYKQMSTFSVDEHKLIDYLEGGIHPGNRKPSLVSNSDYKETEHRVSKQQANFAPNGALVSAGFQVSATVTRTLDAESTLARSCGETTVEPSVKAVRSADLSQELESTLVRSCAETTIQASTKQLMRLDLAEAGSTLARSCGETTIQPSTKMAERKDCSRDARDSASEGHTMAERDLGSTLRLPAQHPPLYNQDRISSDRESNFDSL